MQGDLVSGSASVEHRQSGAARREGQEHGVPDGEGEDVDGGGFLLSRGDDGGADRGAHDG